MHNTSSAVIRLSDDLEAKAAFARHLEEEVGTEVRACYQCGKCSAGCPISFAMDYQPRQVVRMVQLGLKDRVLSCSTIWLCASCNTCSTRCPRGVKITEVMDALRHQARREQVTPKEVDVAKLHDSFLESIRSNGRVHEVGMILGFKKATGRWLEDAALGQKMFFAGKLSLTPHKIKNLGAVKKIYSRIKEMEGNAR